MEKQSRSSDGPGSQSDRFVYVADSLLWLQSKRPTFWQRVRANLDIWFVYILLIGMGILIVTQVITMRNNVAVLQDEVANSKFEIRAIQDSTETVEQPLVTIQNTQLPSSIEADGEQSVELVWQIVDGENEPVADGTLVHFEVTGGQVEPTLGIVQGGVARTRFTPFPWQEGRDQAIIVPSTGGVEKVFTIKLTPPPTLAEIKVETGRFRMLADSQDSTPITVQAINTKGNPMEGISITLRVVPDNAGSVIPVSATTGSDGLAQFTFQAGAQDGAFILIAESRDEPQISTEIGLELVSMSSLALDIASNKMNLSPTGADDALLDVTLSDDLGRPLAGIIVELETFYGRGWFLDDKGVPITHTSTITRTTDRTGALVVTCRGGTTPGNMVIRARAAGRQNEIVLSVDDLQPTTIQIRTDKMELAINGQSDVVATLYITIMDQRGEPMYGFYTVQLEADPPDMVELDDNVSSSFVDQAVQFVASKKTGEVIITASMGEISGSITLTLVEDGD